MSITMFTFTNGYEVTGSTSLVVYFRIHGLLISPVPLA